MGKCDHMHFYGMKTFEGIKAEQPHRINGLQAFENEFTAASSAMMLAGTVELRSVLSPARNPARTSPAISQEPVLQLSCLRWDVM
jgi:hypothetical protein